MKRFVRILGLVAVVALAAGACGGDDDDAAADGAADTGAPATADDLERQTWQLESYVDDSAGALTAASGDSAATAKFDGTSVAGTTGCNQYSANYELSGDGAITVGDTRSTRMACPGDLAPQEQAMLAGLTNSARAVIADADLQLLGENGDVVLVLTGATGQAFVDTTWGLINFRTPTAVTSSLLGADISILFADDGTISGNAGCNDYTGTYTGGVDTTGDLTIDSVERGSEVCTDPAGVAEQEQGYTAALESVAGFEIVANRLTLLDADGRDAATFES